VLLLFFVILRIDYYLSVKRPFCGTFIDGIRLFLANIFDFFIMHFNEIGKPVIIQQAVLLLYI
jgi:hypothetical protein